MKSRDVIKKITSGWYQVRIKGSHHQFRHSTLNGIVTATLRLNVTMDEGLVARIDRVATNRSAFLAEAARERLRELAQD